MFVLWPKKKSYKEFDNEKNIPAARKFPFPPPHNFSNGPSLREAYDISLMCSTMNQREKQGEEELFVSLITVKFFS